MEAHDTHQRRQLWSILGQKLPQGEVVYLTQVLLIYIVILTCIINLSRGQGDSNLWTCLMSSCLGYLLPNPKLSASQKKQLTILPNHDEPDVSHPPQQQL